jgi:hypothetical protein
MEVTYAGKIRPDSSANSTAVVFSSNGSGNSKSDVLSRLGGRPVQSRLGPAPQASSSSSTASQSINSRLGDHVPPPPPTKQQSKQQSKKKKKDPKPALGHNAIPPASAMALDKDLDQYMKMPHKAPDPRQVISYDDVTPPQDDYLLM